MLPHHHPLFGLRASSGGVAVVPPAAGGALAHAPRGDGRHLLRLPLPKERGSGRRLGGRGSARFHRRAVCHNKAHLSASYTSALTLPTDFVSFFLEILLLPTARVPSRTSSRGLKWSISPYIRAYPADNCCLGAPAWRDRLSWAPYFGIGLAPSPSHRVGPAPAPECSTGLRQVSQAGPVVDKVEPDISAHYLLS